MEVGRAIGDDLAWAENVLPKAPVRAIQDFAGVGERAE